MGFTTMGDEVQVDKAAAAAFQAEHEAAMKAKQDHADTLTGKDNKKARTELSKEISAMKNDDKYIDALKIAKELPPPHGNFTAGGGEKKDDSPKKKESLSPEEMLAKAAAAEEEGKDKKEKKEKPKKAMESTGISPAEHAELEDLKQKIIAKKAELKAQGLSGGQQNKDPDVAQMVVRMNELKIKENPELANEGKKEEKKQKGKVLSTEAAAELQKLEQELEEYRQKLVSEFKYSKKEIAADPDFKEMTAKLNAMKK